MKAPSALLAILAAAFTLAAQDTPANSDAPQPPAVIPERLAWWAEARFGLFVHWGPVSLKGTEIGWSRGGERRGYR